MSNVRRVYVEKKPEFAGAAKELRHEIRSYLGIQSLTNVRELIRYDVENISDEVFERACRDYIFRAAGRRIIQRKALLRRRSAYFLRGISAGTV